MWWVSVDNFYRQMLELKSKNIVYLNDYNPNDPNHFVITFDGIYKNVLDYALPILYEFKYPFELFLSSDYIGRDNSFDRSEPLTEFVSLEDLKLLVKNNGRLQWHTKSHPDLTNVQDISSIIFELEIPLALKKIDPKGFNWFAYPYGNFNQIVVEEVKKRFAGGLSCHQGNDTDIYCLNRLTVTNQTTFKKATIGVIIASYNYGSFLVEAIESVLRQTRLPDEILITDDASDDNTYEIADFYQKKYPQLIKVNRNEHNLGIVRHFNRAISLTSSDYITILGADNRYRSDYIEKTSLILDQSPDVAIAYSDFALFGSRAKLVYASNNIKRQGLIKENTFFIINFPDFNEETKNELLTKGNFIHGSSMFRRSAFNEVGGYIEIADVPEDYNLFTRIVKLGWNAKRVPLPILEYRQHSKSQANIRLTTFAEVQFYKQLVKNLYHELQEIKSKFQIANTESVYVSNTSEINNEFELNDINFVIFPDWQQSQEIIFEDLHNVINTIIKHPDINRINLLIDNTGISEEDVNFILADIVFNMLQESEDLDISQEPVFTLVNNLSIQDWKMLVPKITGRLILKAENISLIKNPIIQKIPSYEPDNILTIDFNNILENINKFTDSMRFMFSYGSYFQEIGDADNYYECVEGLVDSLHTSISSNYTSVLWYQVVSDFTQFSNFIPIYFNEKNLRHIYIKRAEIIELFLRLNHHEIDYTFVERSVSRKKIRLGILAAHFTPSAETFAYLPIYEYLSRDFEVILYSLTKTGHQLEQYCQLSANEFKLLPQELLQQVNTIRADDLDILFIATNVTAVTNPICLLATHRLARIQVTSGGSVVTTGMRNIDYYISGTLTDPSPTAQDQYQEKLIKIEGSAHCFSYGTEEGKLTTPVERNNLGIPTDAVVFISGANYFKIVPELMETWTKIISRVSNSVLVLLPFGPNWSKNYPKTDFINHLNSTLSNHGLTTERLIVLDPQPVPNREDMKEYYKIADVYLDSYPFGGTTSLIEPLQVNLPVITRQGNCFRSAMGAAIVQTLNISDLVADSEEVYIKLAVALGNNSELRHEKSAEIKARMQGNPSFLNSRSYSAKIGSLFQEIFSKYLTDTLNQNFRLGDINLIIFPDWSQTEESISLDLEQAIKTVVTHPRSEKTTLLININNVAVEDVELLLSSVTMNLLMQEDLDVTEGLEISLVENLSDIQWKALLPCIHARISLEHEDRDALIQAQAETLLTYELESLSYA